MKHLAPVVLGLLLHFALTSDSLAQRRDVPVPPGGFDLTKDPALSRPFTILDQLLLGLQRQAEQEAGRFRPERGDYRPSRVAPDAFAVTRYEPDIARVGILFSVNVTGMDDPWREVCRAHLKRLVSIGALGIPRRENTFLQPGFLDHLVGPKSHDPAFLRAMQPFLDSIVVSVQFAVESGKREQPLRALRSCFYDNKTGNVTFSEYEYPK